MQREWFRQTCLLSACLTVLFAAGTIVGGCTGDSNSGGATAEGPAAAVKPPSFTEAPAVAPVGTLKTDVPYVPTPMPVVDRMLELAEVDEGDVVYDLGSGDGRIVVRAAKKYGARGVGVEIDPKLIKRARERAREAGVADRVEFRQGDLFEANIGEATAVTLYLLPSINLKLRPKLIRALAPGTPVVSHAFDMGEWTPERTVTVGDDTIYRWTIPDEPPSFVDESMGEGSQ